MVVFMGAGRSRKEVYCFCPFVGTSRYVTGSSLIINTTVSTYLVAMILMTIEPGIPLASGYTFDNSGAQHLFLILDLTKIKVVKTDEQSSRLNTYQSQHPANLHR